jgi:hypothetical protein
MKQPLSSREREANTFRFPKAVLPSKRAGWWLGLAACLALFVVYASHRQRYIWGVDSFGYYELGRLLSRGEIYLATAYPPAEHPSLIPLGFSLQKAQYAGPNYPPGFPAFLAIGHWLHGPFFVTPFLGVVSCVLLFSLLLRRVRPGSAFLLTLAWAFMPLTVFGSTMVMSDLVAGTVLLGAQLAFQHRRIAVTAWLLGLAIAVRPTNTLFLVPFAFLLRADRTTLRLILHLIAPCALYGAYNHCLYGAPWRTGYGDVFTGFEFALIPSHVRFYATTTLMVLSPVIVFLAFFGLFPWNREKIFLLTWPLGLTLFYAAWVGGNIDWWWWVRFLLPAYPALFLLAGDGFEKLRTRCERAESRRSRITATATLAAVLLAVPVYYIWYGLRQGDVWRRDTGAIYHRVVERVHPVAPTGSLVGSVEFVSCFRLYSALTPFVSIHPDAPELISRTLREGRPVFLLVEPWNKDEPAVRTALERFQTHEVDRYDFIWGGLPLYELSLR